jgi:hypothetical protein
MSTVRLPRRVFLAATRLLVVTLSVSAAGPFAHALENHDADFQVVVHDASQHRFTGVPAAGATDAGQHCAACHLVRVAKQPRLQATGEPPIEVAAGLLDRGAVAAHVSLDLRLPARAPPSLG